MYRSFWLNERKWLHENVRRK